MSLPAARCHPLPPAGDRHRGSPSAAFAPWRALLAGSLLALAPAGRAEVFVYPAPAGVSTSALYRVEIQQGATPTPVPVLLTAARQPTNLSQDTAWASFAFTGRVTVKVTMLAGPFTRCRVLPSHRAITPRGTGHTAVFELDRPGQFAVEFDERTEHPLLVFADPPETDVPSRHDPAVRWFGPGVHDLGEAFIEVQPGQTVYLAPGAFVRGRLRGRAATGARVTGRGVFSGSHLPANPPGSYTVPHLLDFDERSHGVHIEGITLIDSPHYNLVARGDDSVVRNVKAIGWCFGTDGIGTGRRGLVEDCFLKVNDDALKLYRSGMIVRRCTIWQLENGAPFQLGWSTNSDNSGFRISDCDVIRVEHHQDTHNRAVFNSIHGGRGNLGDYVFEDIRIENARHRLLLLTVRKTSWSRAEAFGNITGLVFRRITAQEPFRLASLIKSFESTGRFADIRFEALRIAGRLITSAADGEIEIDAATAERVRFSPAAATPP